MRYAAYAGIAVPIVWFALLLLGGALVPGYDPVRRYMTELTDGPTWGLVLADFVVVSALLAIFAAGLRVALGGDGVATVIALLVLVKALATLATGLVHGDVDPLVRTPSGQLHNMLVAGGNVALAIACLVAARRLRSLPGWNGLAAYSLGTAAATLLLLVALATLTTAGTGRADAPLAAAGGLVQRLSMLVTMLWPAVIGRRMLRLAAPRPAPALHSHT